MTEIDPIELFNPQRMDLAVKYLYAKAVLHGCFSHAAESLYLRHIFFRTNGAEPKNEFGNSEKNSLEDYKKQMIALCQAMQNRGFDKNCPVPLGRNNAVLNGAHRIAVAAALNMNIEAEFFDKEASRWDWSWFEKNGFGTEDKMRMLKTFRDVRPNNTSIALLFAPAFDYWSQIEALAAAENLQTAGYVDLDFEDNFLAFKNLLLDVYEVWDINQSKKETIIAKAEFLSAAKLTVRCIVFYDDGGNVYQKTLALKSKVRVFLNHKIPKQIFATMHSADGERESRHLANVLLSPNNIRHLRMRISNMPRQTFLIRCNVFKNMCRKKGIDLRDVCVVGSSTMDVLGIRESGDLDCIMKKSEKTLGKGFDVVQNYARHDVFLNDNLLIDDDDFHFYFNGLKFVNLEIVKARKLYQQREKDCADVRKIELLENYWAYVDKDRFLKRRADFEFARRAGYSGRWKRLKYFLLYHLFWGKRRRKYKQKYKLMK